MCSGGGEGGGAHTRVAVETVTAFIAVNTLGSNSSVSVVSLCFHFLRIFKDAGLQSIFIRGLLDSLIFSSFGNISGCVAYSITQYGYFRLFWILISKLRVVFGLISGIAV